MIAPTFKLWVGAMVTLSGSPLRSQGEVTEVVVRPLAKISYRVKPIRNVTISGWRENDFRRRWNANETWLMEELDIAGNGLDVILSML